MRPSRTLTDPSITSRASFIVRIVALRTIVDGTEVGPLHRELRGRRSPSHGDELGKNADGDLGRRHGADLEADGCVNPRQALGRQTLLEQERIDARNLCPAPDQTEVAQITRG